MSNVQKMPRATLWFCPFLENCPFLSKKRSAPQKFPAHALPLSFPLAALGWPVPHQVFSQPCTPSLLLPHEPAGSSKRHGHGCLLREAHIPRGARCGCVPARPPPEGQADTSVSPAQAARVPLQPCWAGLGAGHSNHLAEFTASPESASLHFSWAGLRLCLNVSHVGLAAVGYVTHSHPSTASAESAYSDVCWAALPRGWLLTTNQQNLSEPPFFSGCQTYCHRGKKGTPGSQSNKASLNGFLCTHLSANSAAQNESGDLSGQVYPWSFTKGIQGRGFHPGLS